jgi:hypothetical protein
MKMKNGSKIIFSCLFAVIVAVTFVGCGANPKGLAKQAYDLTQQATAATTSGNLSKAASLAQKALKIQAKVEGLSESDQDIFEEEYSRLSGY